ncbi:MAG: hypothetical protein K0Q72_374 [Armatimonadetes bacterium]|nr:hypothetical protein [Armatimonadota bacterium]
MRISRLKSFVATIVALGVAAVLLPRAASAAPPVALDGRAISTSQYDAASVLAGFPAWGTAEQCDRAAYVMVRLDSDRLRLTIGLPRSVSGAAATRWLSSVSDEQRWANVSLFYDPQPGALYLRADVVGPVHRAGIGGSEATVDLGRLAARIRELTPLPVLAGVRLTGSHLISASPPAEFTSKLGADTYLFYKSATTGAAAAPLTVRYGMPPRWIAAAACGLLIWLLFPVLALYGARFYLLGQTEVEPRQRLVLFRRWQRAIAFVPAAMALGTVFLVRGSFLMFFGRALAGLLPVLLVLPWLGTAFLGRLIGLPLERAAWPDRPPLPWYRAAKPELFGLVLTGAMMLCVGAVSVSGGTLRLPFGAVTVGPGLFFVVPVLLVIGTVSWAAVVNFRRKRGTIRDEPEAPEAIRASVHELTTRLGCPINQVRIGKRRDGLIAGTVIVLNDLAVVGAEIVEAVEPDQLAALIAAAALTLPRTRADKWVTYGLTAMILVPTGLMCLAFLWRSWQPSGASSMSWVLLAQPLIFGGAMLSARRAQNQMQRADLRAAEALGEPLRFVQALRKLEEIQLAGSGTDPSATRRLPMAQRRLRLEQKLGLE